MSTELNEEMYEFNREVVAALIEDGANEEAFFTIEHHFACEQFEPLEKAAVAFFKFGLDVMDAEEFETEDGEVVFSFDVITEQQLNAEKLDVETDKMIELAQRFDVEYDGWGTYLEDEDE